MAAKEIQARYVSWSCTECRAKSSKNIQTTDSAEQHADGTGHRVIASGMITFQITPSKSILDDDPFAPRTRQPARPVSDGSPAPLDDKYLPEPEEPDPGWPPQGS